MIDDGLQRFADVAKRERLAQDFRARLAFLDFVLHDLVRHSREIGADQPSDLSSIRLGGSITGFALGPDHRASGESRQQLVGGLLLDLADARRDLQRVVVAALEIVELQDDGELLAQHRLVCDVVLREHRFGIAAQLRGERVELGVVANDFVQLAVDLVGEPRHVRGFFDALLFLRMHAAGQCQRHDEREQFCNHGRSFPRVVAGNVSETG